MSMTLKANAGTAAGTIDVFAPQEPKPAAPEMVIERKSKATGEISMITFSQACGELSNRFASAFAAAQDEFSDTLAETFFEGGVVETLKAEYRFWLEPERSAPARDWGDLICLSNRKQEFIEAVRRGENSKLEVYENWDKNSFVVVNLDNQNEYGVNLLNVDELVLVDCDCADFVYRNRVCKHIGAVLVDRMFGLSAHK